MLHSCGCIAIVIYATIAINISSGNPYNHLLPVPISSFLPLSLCMSSATSCRWHIKLITHVIILAKMKYATIYNRGQNKIRSTCGMPPSPSLLPRPLLKCGYNWHCCSHFALLVKMRQIRIPHYLDSHLEHSSVRN